MIAEIMILILALVFLLVGVCLCCGKGKWLIAGYNTMSEEDRKKYDEKSCVRLWEVYV